MRDAGTTGTLSPMKRDGGLIPDLKMKNVLVVKWKLCVSGGGKLRMRSKGAYVKAVKHILMGYFCK